MLTFIYALATCFCLKRIGPARANLHTRIIFTFRVASLQLTRIIYSQFLTQIVSSLNPFIGTPSCRQRAFYCLLPTAMTADQARILIELNTGLSHLSSTKLACIFSLATTAIFISTLVVGSSSSLSASDLTYIYHPHTATTKFVRVHVCFCPDRRRIYHGRVSILVRFATHAINAFTITFL